MNLLIVLRKKLKRILNFNVGIYFNQSDSIIFIKDLDMKPCFSG